MTAARKSAPRTTSGCRPVRRTQAARPDESRRSTATSRRGPSTAMVDEVRRTSASRASVTSRCHAGRRGHASSGADTKIGGRIASPDLARRGRVTAAIGVIRPAAPAGRRRSSTWPAVLAAASRLSRPIAVAGHRPVELAVRGRAEVESLGARVGRRWLPRSSGTGSPARRAPGPRRAGRGSSDPSSAATQPATYSSSATVSTRWSTRTRSAPTTRRATSEPVVGGRAGTR